MEVAPLEAISGYKVLLYLWLHHLQEHCLSGANKDQQYKNTTFRLWQTEQKTKPFCSELCIYTFSKMLGMLLTGQIFIPQRPYVILSPQETFL